jgi:hypothetical protein
VEVIVLTEQWSWNPEFVGHVQAEGGFGLAISVGSEIKGRNEMRKNSTAGLARVAEAYRGRRSVSASMAVVGGGFAGLSAQGQAV